MTEWEAKIEKGDYTLQFHTNDREKYQYVEKACNKCTDKVQAPALGEWISVEDRLPNILPNEIVSDYVLVWLESKIGGGVPFVMIYRREYPPMNSDVWCYLDLKPIDEKWLTVTHWMPLPKRPEVKK